MWAYQCAIIPQFLLSILFHIFFIYFCFSLQAFRCLQLSFSHALSLRLQSKTEHQSVSPCPRYDIRHPYSRPVWSFALSLPEWALVSNEYPLGNKSHKVLLFPAHDNHWNQHWLFPAALRSPPPFYLPQKGYFHLIIQSRPVLSQYPDSLPIRDCYCGMDVH